MKKYQKICVKCGNTFETDNKYAIDCPFCIEKHNVSKAGEYLRMLDDAGWSELIDERWRSAVKCAILDYDPSASQTDIDYVLDLVIW